MSLKRSFKHILLQKHPKLLETLIQRLKHVKNSQHHRLPNKQKCLTKYCTGRNDREEMKRRAHVASEEDNKHSKYFKDSLENVKLHNIREASSYSDEEDQLRNNLHDALTHGNWTFESFRKSGGDTNNKQTLQVLSTISTETDDEWILKNNIYKVFEQDREKSV